MTFKYLAAARRGHSRRTQGDVRRRAESVAVYARFVGMAAKRGKGVGPPFQQVIVEVKADPWRGNEDEIVDLVRLIRIDVAVIFAANLQIGRAHVCTPVTNAHLVCRLLLEKKKPYLYTKNSHLILCNNYSI